MTGQKLFGYFVPGSTLMHRAPLWLKALLLVVLSLLLAFTRSWQVSLGTFLFVMVLGLLAGISPKSWWASFAPLRWILLVLVGYYTFTGALASGGDVLLTLFTMIAYSRILLTTTAIPAVIDGLVTLISPLKKLGVPTERFALALALMIRSIPVLFNEYTVLTQAAQARGVKPAPHRLMVPWVISAVGFAQQTGDALTARGLDSE